MLSRRPCQYIFRKQGLRRKPRGRIERRHRDDQAHNAPLPVDVFCPVQDLLHPVRKHMLYMAGIVEDLVGNKNVLFVKHGKL